MFTILEKLKESNRIVSFYMDIACRYRQEDLFPQFITPKFIEHQIVNQREEVYEYRCFY